MAAKSITGGKAGWLDNWSAFADNATGALLEQVQGNKLRQHELELARIDASKRTGANAFVDFLRDNWKAIAVSVIGGIAVIVIAKKAFK